jgi:hypothetical protein
MCIKPPFTQTNAQRSYAIYQGRCGEGLRMSYWDNPPYIWGVSQVKRNLGHVDV